MSAAQDEEQVSLKLVINKETNKVLFAEAEKDFVDVLCSFLTLPLGTIARLVGQSTNIGCLNSLYQSVANLEVKHLSTATCKEMLLRPRNTSEDFCRTLKLNIDDTEPTKYFMFHSFVCLDFVSCYCLSTFKSIRCPCGKLLDRSVFLKSSNVNCDGFVQRGATFIITDDLIIRPNSMETSFGVIQNFEIKNTSSVKQITVNVTKEKLLDLLKCSLFSKSALSDLFLETKPFLQPERLSACCFVNNSNNNNTNGFQIKVKLFMRKSDGKIVFAQGEEDFADFVFSFLTFPLGGVVRMFRGYSSLGSIDGLYKSMNDLNGCKYFMSDDIKNRLVDPFIASQFKLSKQILPIKEPPLLQYYYDDRDDFITASSENRALTGDRCKLVDPKSSTGSNGGGYVKGPAVFMATDDLVVLPMTPSSALSLLDSLQTPPTELKEKIVTIGFNEGCSILKAALTSKSALTNGLRHLITQVKEEK